jgi:hypothetical protein
MRVIAYIRRPHPSRQGRVHAAGMGNVLVMMRCNGRTLTHPIDARKKVRSSKTLPAL